MKVTVADVMAWGPCPEYTEEKVKKLFGRRRKLSGLQIAALRIKPDDIFWAVLKHGFLPDKSLRHFACDCAEHVLHFFEEQHPEDKRPRQSIEMARCFAEGFATYEELATAGDASWAAARDASRAASRDASRAASWAASWDASRAASWVASQDASWAASWAASRDTAGAAAWAASWAAAGAAEQKWQLKTLRKYLKREGKP